jgi:hypothetical protein
MFISYHILKFITSLKCSYRATPTSWNDK